MQLIKSHEMIHRGKSLISIQLSSEKKEEKQKQKLSILQLALSLSLSGNLHTLQSFW